MKKSKFLIIGLILLSFILVGIAFVFLGDIIPMHFGINGEPDQFGSKYFMLIFPTISLLVGLSMLLVAKYAKVSDNYRKYLLLTSIILLLVFVVVEITFIVYALSYAKGDYNFEISKVMLPLLGTMFIIMGNFMPKIEKNSTLGVKTYWSMYNETTWQKTHRFAGFVGVVVGIVVLAVSFFFNDIVNFIILMSAIAVFTISTTVASYIYYKEERTLEDK